MWAATTSAPTSSSSRRSLRSCTTVWSDDGISEELINHVADRLGHDRRYGIDPTKIKNDLGWYPETPFEKGIVLTIDWYLDQRGLDGHTSPAAIIRNITTQMYKNR